MRCAFCEKPEIKERAVISNDFAFAFLTNIPITPGHILIAPIRCAVTFNELRPAERNAIFELRKKLAPVMKRLFGAEGFHFAWNEGEIAGQSVPHFHFHMVPRKKGDAGVTEYEPRKFLYRPGSREESPETELATEAAMIRMAFAKK